MVELIVCMFILVYACYLDIKERHVTNLLWLLMIAVGISFAIYDIITLGKPYLSEFIYSVVFTSALSYLFFKLNFFGGADAKCLMAISVLIPTTPIPDPFPFAITTLFNAVIVSVTVPVVLFLYNLLHLDTKPGNILASFTGYKVPIADLERKRNLRLVHEYEEEGSKRKYIFGGLKIDKGAIEELKKYHEQGNVDNRVWVTPELPFMLFITAGFFISMIYGNLIFDIIAIFVYTPYPLFGIFSLFTPLRA